MTKPYAESCDQNRQAILEILQLALPEQGRLLEIGSGTGQHAVFFSRYFPQLTWQTSDLSSNHAGIQAWIDEEEESGVLPPIELDVLQVAHWNTGIYDAVFSANAVHIMSWPAVEALFTGIGKILHAGGRLILYGPFNYHGQYTSDSNAGFDLWLKQRDPESGIRHFEELNQLARQQGMTLLEDYEMPANNRILIWQKQS